MSDIACKAPADPKLSDSRLSREVLEWRNELRVIWEAAGLSMNQFACLYGPIDKGTISRYLSGQRVPRDRWFLDKLLAIQADKGQPLTPDVREHLTELHLRALATAHPHEYRVRLVSDELEIALTSKLEAEHYARALEEKLAERNRQIQELTDDQGRLRVAWDVDRIAMQAEYERLTREIEQITVQLDLARERMVQAERRCQQLEDILDHLDARSSADKYSTGADFPVDHPDDVARQLAAFLELGMDDQILVLAERAAAQVSLDDYEQVDRLIGVMRNVGAIEQAHRLGWRAAFKLSIQSLSQGSLHHAGVGDLTRLSEPR